MIETRINRYKVVIYCSKSHMKLTALGHLIKDVTVGESALERMLKITKSIVNQQFVMMVYL